MPQSTGIRVSSHFYPVLQLQRYIDGPMRLFKAGPCIAKSTSGTQAHSSLHTPPNFHECSQMLAVLCCDVVTSGPGMLEL